MIACAEDLPQLSLAADDRILVLAPHPDDETIGAAGIIQEALLRKLPLKIVYLTNGDDNEVSFIVYKKRPVITRKGLLKMGRMRQQEAVDAMTLLGVHKEQLIFLGYPDGGTLPIFLQHWGIASAYKSRLTRSAVVPYQDAPSYKTLHKGENVVKDLKKVIADFHPTKIFVTMPVDTNTDHQAAFLFLKVALWDLEKEMIIPQIMTFLVHAPRWPNPQGLEIDQALLPPKALQDSLIKWMAFSLGAETLSRKQNAVTCYKSQIEYRPKYLYSFVRTNELFGFYPSFDLKSVSGSVNWDIQALLQHFIPALSGQAQKNTLQSMAYAVSDGQLQIRMKVNPWTAEFSSMDLFLMPYRRGTDFEQMPKLKIHVDFNAFVTVYNQAKKAVLNSFSYEYSKKDGAFIFKIPLQDLGDPDYLLSSARCQAAGWPMEMTGWRSFSFSGN